MRYRQDNSIHKAGLTVSSGRAGLANRQVNHYNGFQTQTFHFKQSWNRIRGYKKNQHQTNQWNYLTKSTYKLILCGGICSLEETEEDIPKYVSNWSWKSNRFTSWHSCFQQFCMHFVACGWVVCVCVPERCYLVIKTENKMGRCKPI
jgi:hypothetical protein